MNIEGSNPGPVEDIVAFESNDSDPYSIIQFLQLPTITTRVKSRRGDPIIDYTKSIILSSSQYVEAAAKIRLSKEVATREKAAQKELREETKRRKDQRS